MALGKEEVAPYSGKLVDFLLGVRYSLEFF